MKKIILSIMLILSFANAKDSDIATKEDIKAIRDDIRLLVHQIDKRFEQVDKRFEMMQRNMDKRFEAVDKHFEAVNKRFEQVDKRLDLLQKEIEERAKTTNYLMVAFFVLIMGYLLKERSSIKKDIKAEIEPELFKKVDKNTVEKIIAVIEEMAKKDEEMREILEKHHLKFVA